MTQGKLAMGFRTGIDAWDEDYPALMLLNAVYGGTTTSKFLQRAGEALPVLLCQLRPDEVQGRDAGLLRRGVLQGGPGAGRDPLPSFRPARTAALQTTSWSGPAARW